MRVTLPLPPSANNYWRRWRGRIVTSDEARAYKHKAALLAKAQGLRMLQGGCAVTLRIFRAQRRGDTDNFLKVCLDSLNGIAWADDSQVVEIHAYRQDDKADPRVELEITQAS